jgi:acyl carrier protein
MQMIANIIGNVLNQTNIVENDDMTSVPNWDSLNHINIILEIEKTTGYKFSPINISQATSIKKIHDLITLKKEFS